MRVEGLMNCAERERVGNSVCAQFGQHDLQRELRLHITKQAGRCRRARQLLTFLQSEPLHLAGHRFRQAAVESD